MPLPLAPRELARRFPMLWQTRKAAERWTAKNPPEAIRDIIRVWGFVTIIGRRAKRAGHKRWCGPGPMRVRRSRRCWASRLKAFR